jgi:hypothetical protein
MHFSAGACLRTIPKNEMHAGNAGAFSGECVSAHDPEKRSAKALAKMQDAFFSA